jgi:hypothetical protein
LGAAVLLGSALRDCPVAASGRTAGVKIEESEDNRNSREVPPERIARGKRGRRLTRIDVWISGLEGDKKRIYERYGHPSGRYREESMGTVVEKWVYSDKGKTFTFKGNKLVR